MPPLNKAEVIIWIDHLAKSELGQIMLINLYHSIGLIPRRDIDNFLDDWINECKATSTLHSSAPFSSIAHKSFKKICENDKYFGLKVIPVASTINGSDTLASTMDARIFHEFIINKHLATTVSFDLDPDPATHDETEYKADLNIFLSFSDWYDINGSLGLNRSPDFKPVWITTHEHIRDALASSRPVTNATKVRDALGLSHWTSNAHILLLTFPVDKLHDISAIMSGFKMARPCFADTTNPRFAVYINAAAASIYLDEWGQTVHLDKLRRPHPHPINGHPERVCSPIPLKEIGHALKVDSLGFLDTQVDANDAAFIERLCDVKSFADILTDLKNSI